jgi:hypothetical protein
MNFLDYGQQVRPLEDAPRGPGEPPEANFASDSFCGLEKADDDSDAAAVEIAKIRHVEQNALHSRLDFLENRNL